MTRRLALVWLVLAVLAAGAHWISRDAEAPLARTVGLPFRPPILLSEGADRVVVMEFSVLREPPMGGRPTIALHLVDAEGRTVRNLDRRPACWMPGSATLHRVMIEPPGRAPSLAPGTYRLVGCLWDPATGRRFTVEQDGGERDRFPVGEVVVPETGS